MRAVTAEEALASIHPRSDMGFGGRNFGRTPLLDRRTRTDLWRRIGDALYRLWLDRPRIAELERCLTYSAPDGTTHGAGILRTYGAVARGRYELDGRNVGFAAEGVASAEDCLAIVRAALVGGRVMVADGEPAPVHEREARLVVDEYLAQAPVIERWDLAFAILHTTIHGREATPAEVENIGPIVIPAFDVIDAHL